MSQLFLTVTLGVLFNHSFAQINISSFPVAGDTIILKEYYPVTPPIIFSQFNQTGLNYIWDFSEWSPGNSDTLTFDQPAGNLFSNEFQDAHLAMINNGQDNSEFLGKIKYLKQTGNQLLEIGTIANVNDTLLVPLKNLDEFKLFSFPVNFGQTFTDTSVTLAKLTGEVFGIPYDSIMQRSTIYRYDTIDGTGQFIMNGYTYQNLYRNVITDSVIDSVFVYSQPSGWEFFETNTDERVNILWHSESDFFSAWLEFRNDTAYKIKILQYKPSVRLELVNFLTEGDQGKLVQSFEVRAYNISDNSLNTNFNDSIYIFIDSLNYLNYGIRGNVEKAQNGIAVFDSLSFLISGNISVFATSDTADNSSNHTIFIHPAPDSIAIVGLLSANEAEILPSFTVNLYNTSGLPDTHYSGMVNIGKLAGNGKMSGTLSKPVINGVATFDDISFNYTDVYNIIAWVPGIDSAAIDSEYVTITSNPNLQWVAVDTDTLSEYVDRASFFVWTGGQDGYLSGTSREWYDHVGQHYSFSSKGSLTKVIFYIALWQQVNNSIINDTYKLKVYDAGVLLQNQSSFNAGIIQDSLPITLLGEQEFSASIFQPTDFFVRIPTVVTFDTPIDIYSDFIVALEVNSTTTDDTVAIWTSTIGDGLMENRSMRHTINNTDPPMTEGWVRDLNWRPTYDVDNMIMPVIEVDTMDIITSVVEDGISKTDVYPNPTTGLVYFTSANPISKIELADLSGRLVYSYSTPQNSGKISLSFENLSNGIYTAQIYFSNTSSVNEKLVILKP
ncbi:MAG: T9SS type A sorting domain-containing protein [Bacteroidia bacterium]